MIATIRRFGGTALAVCLCFGSAIAVRAQTGGTGGRTGGGGNGGGFTGGGGGNQSRTGGSSGSAASSIYPSSTMLGDVTLSVDPETKRVFYITDPETAASVSNVLAHLDRPKPQVLIKVVFLEVQHDNALDFGVEGSYTHSIGSPFSSVTSFVNSNGMTQFMTNLIPQSYSVGNNFGLAGLGTTGQTIGQTTMPPGAGLYSVVGSDYNATVRAIASAEKVEVLSRPSIMVRNNQPANINIGQLVPLVTGVTVNGLTGGPTSSITYQPVGVGLQVTPFITPDGLVEMILSPQISDLSSQTVQVSSNVFAPVIDQRAASTVVVTPDGQTIIIGGLMENDKTTIDSKIPILGDIPLLGNLFKHHQKAVTKKELLIFVTPHVVITPTQIAQESHAESSKAELAPKAFTEQELNKFFDTLPIKPVPDKKP
jgi:general secretion pathway protein D